MRFVLAFVSCFSFACGDSPDTFGPGDGGDAAPGADAGMDNADAGPQPKSGLYEIEVSVDLNECGLGIGPPQGGLQTVEIDDFVHLPYGIVAIPDWARTAPGYSSPESFTCGRSQPMAFECPPFSFVAEFVVQDDGEPVSSIRETRFAQEHTGSWTDLENFVQTITHTTTCTLLEAAPGNEHVCDTLHDPNPCTTTYRFFGSYVAPL